MSAIVGLWKAIPAADEPMTDTATTTAISGADRARCRWP